MLAVFPAESLAWVVKLAVPATGVVPETRPELERLNPTAVRLLVPNVTVQVYGVPAPPEAASCCE
jgi:hypothetical protein